MSDRRTVGSLAAAITGITIGATCAIVPLILTAMYARDGAPFLLNTYGPQFQPWELFGACVSATLIVALSVAFLRGQRVGIGLLPFVVVTVIAFRLLALLTDYAEFAVDAPAWQTLLHRSEGNAHDSLIHAEASQFLPSTIAVTRILSKIVGVGWRIGGADPDRAQITFGTLYLWQCCHFFALVGSLLLLSKAWSNRSNDPPGWLVPGGLMVLSFALLRALRHCPTIPLLLLAGTVVMAYGPTTTGRWWQGLALAAAAWLNAFALVLLAPFVAARRWGIMWRAAVCMGLLLIPWIVQGNMRMWGMSLQAVWDYQLHRLPVAAGLQGAFRHTFFRVGLGEAAFWPVAIVDAALLVFVLRRIGHRSNKVRAGLTSDSKAHLALSIAETAALLALLSPTPSGGEYLLVLPLAVVAVRHGLNRPYRLGVGLVLALLLPGIDILLFRCYRVVGTLVLLLVVPQDLDVEPQHVLWKKELKNRETSKHEPE